MQSGALGECQRAHEIRCRFSQVRGRLDVTADHFQGDIEGRYPGGPLRQRAAFCWRTFRGAGDRGSLCASRRLDRGGFLGRRTRCLSHREDHRRSINEGQTSAVANWRRAPDDANLARAQWPLSAGFRKSVYYSGADKRRGNRDGGGRHTCSGAQRPALPAGEH